MRTIDADELLKALGFEESKRGMVRPGSTFDVILNAPTIDAEPVRHGRWEKRDGKTWCSLCGASNKAYEPPYCPHCGVKMDGGNE